MKRTCQILLQNEKEDTQTQRKSSLQVFLEDNLIPDLVFAMDVTFSTCTMLAKRIFQTYMTLLSSKTMK